MENQSDSGTDPEGYNKVLDHLSAERLTSARTVLTPLIQTFAPTSALDVGCGHGAWLQAARELGVETVQGVDGPWIDTAALMIPTQNFTTHGLDQPLDLDRTFDLVISLEVAEHLPENTADLFVESLVKHGNIVLSFRLIGLTCTEASRLLIQPNIPCHSIGDFWMMWIPSQTNSLGGSG